MKCRLCLNENSKMLFAAQNVHGRHIWSQDQFNIYECPDCGVVFTDVDANAEFYKKYYPSGYYPQQTYPSWMNRALLFFQNLSFWRRLRLIRKYHPKAHRILEVGCARGEFLQYLPSTFEKHGIEINREGYQHIKEKYKDIAVYDVRLDSVETEMGSYGLYDAILMWHVLEHVKHPDVFISNIKKLLSKDGVFIFEIPNRNSLGFNFIKQRWFHLDTPRHLFHYDYESIKELMRKHNFDIVKYQGDALDYFQDLASSFYALAQGRSFLFKIIAILLILPVAVIVRLIVALFIPRLAELNLYVVKHSV